jgi:uncharacterized protein (DUF1778 family)
MTKTKLLQIRVTDEQHERISNAAKEHGLSISAYVLFRIDPLHEKIATALEKEPATPIVRKLTGKPISRLKGQWKPK